MMVSQYMSNARKTGRLLLLGLTALLSLVFPLGAYSQVALQDIGFQAASGNAFEIDLQFSAPPPAPETFMLEDPARLTMDFTNVTSELQERRFPLTFAGAESVMVLEAQGRTRMVVNLAGRASYATRVEGNSLVVIVTTSAASSAAPVAAAPVQQVQRPRAAAGSSDIAGIDFRRGDGSTGEIVIDLARDGLVPSIAQNGNRLEIEFANAVLSDAMQMRLDVTDFGTAVQAVNLYASGANVVAEAEILGQFDYVASQNGNQYVVSVTPNMPQSVSGAGSRQFRGENINMDFQDIEIRAALQILADFNDFSLVVPDTVAGSLTMRLDDVPWDQALDMILRSRGLGQRLTGTVLYVAPAEEIASAELAELESNQRADTLAPLVTEYFEINYAVASNLLPLLQGAGGEGGGGGGSSARGILTPRVSASVDQRTNTLIVQDVQSVIDDVRSLLSQLDVPVRQVLIEARIVNASTSFSQGLGIRWGGAQTFPDSRETYLVTGDLQSNVDFGNSVADFNAEVAAAVAGGASLEEALATTRLTGPNFPDALVVDLGLPGASSSFALGYAGDNGLLQLELSALEASGNGEVVAQPKVTTQDQQTAEITSGLQIPYQSQAGGTAGGTTTQFVTAALSLEVTPQITPDGRIIMLLDIHQDSVVPGSGAVPAIATNSVTTRVLVNNGDTVVLGGVFRKETTTTVSKTPLLGDLPYVGYIFKRTEESESKTELLIFITPSIINEIM